MKIRTNLWQNIFMKYLILSLAILFSSQILFGQNTSEKIKERDELKTAKLYFAQDEKCRKLYSKKKDEETEAACNLAVSMAENLPKSRYMEKHSAYRMLGLTLLWQRKFEQAISYFNKALEIGKPMVDDNDAETGEVYYLLGQTHHLLGQTEIAKDFYIKAENTYRTAFKKMGDSEIRSFYPKPIINILEAHLILVKDSGLSEDIEKIEKRLEETKLEFAEFLEN